ncbi:MAG TPA: DUF3084 domain-containing protein [Candidatus Rubrimentiphilum sp.]|nr:DUF3084 domain-containing protein [Candidatus Rubrimentiphilum sp.]
MNLVDLIRGAGTILFIVALAGLIAYAGDRIGHQVGRKRLTLLNIRPRYTSTIIAVATGMIIALIVTLAAIFASNQVKTAFFSLNQINAEIAKARARANEAESKVNNGRLVVGVGTPMGYNPVLIPQDASPQMRRRLVKQLYDQTVAYVNQVYPPLGLRPFKPPADVQQVLDNYADSPEMRAALAEGDVLVLAAADQNLYAASRPGQLGDEVHFGITPPIPDRLMYKRGDLIAYESVPSGKNINAQLAVYELLANFVPQKATSDGFPPYFVSNVKAVQSLPPSAAQMQTMLANGTGNYVLSAFAATDIYPHTLALPVVVVLQKVP